MEILMILLGVAAGVLIAMAIGKKCSMWTRVKHYTGPNKMYVALNSFIKLEDASFIVWIKLVWPDGKIAYSTARFMIDGMSEVVRFTSGEQQGNMLYYKEHRNILRIRNEIREMVQKK